MVRNSIYKNITRLLGGIVRFLQPPAIQTISGPTGAYVDDLWKF
jgi:hypothetical protein